MNIKPVLILVAMMCMMQGCVSTQFAQIDAGPVAVESLTLTASDASWNRAPGILTAFLHPGSELWTRDGVMLDRLMIITGIGNGQTLFKSGNDSLVYPSYRRGMLPNEIAELTVASLTKMFGSGAVVESKSLRPYRLGERKAAAFDLRITSTENATLSGRGIAFTDQDELYLILYIAAEIYYFDKHWGPVQELVGSLAA